MLKKTVVQIMINAGFTPKESSSLDTFEKIYKCGARASYFFDSKDKSILLNWNVTRDSEFTFPRDFPMVNSIHYHKATTNHRFENFSETLSNLEESFNLK